MSNYNIGDEVFVACSSVQDKRVICRDCAGQKYLTVILGNGESHTIACETCQRCGYEAPSGYERFPEHFSKVEKVTVTGMEIKADEETEYRVKVSSTCSNIYKASQVYKTAEEAQVKAEEIAAERTLKNEEAFKRKVKDHKTWSWHVTYHRRQIKEEQRRLEYHTKALDYAKSVSKQIKSED